MKSIIATSEMKIASAILAMSLVFSTAVVFADDATTQVIVSGSAPTISGTPSINGGAAISLTENTTTNVAVTFEVSDANGCQEVVDSGSATVNLYRSGATCTADNPADCYYQESCTVDSGSCTGGGDTTLTYTCTVPVQFYADATDTGSAYAGENWIAVVNVTDGGLTASSTASGVEVNTTLALAVTASIDYGTLAAGADTGATNQTTTITNTGNLVMDPTVEGDDMTSGGNTIAVGNQEYSETGFTWGGGTDLTTTGVNTELAIPTGSGSTDELLWGIGVPGGTQSGTYTGLNTFTAVSGL